jgi:hypothetical protein
MTDGVPTELEDPLRGTTEHVDEFRGVRSSSGGY